MLLLAPVLSNGLAFFIGVVVPTYKCIHIMHDHTIATVASPPPTEHGSAHAWLAYVLVCLLLVLPLETATMYVGAVPYHAEFRLALVYALTRTNGSSANILYHRYLHRVMMFAVRPVANAVAFFRDTSTEELLTTVETLFVTSNRLSADVMHDEAWNAVTEVALRMPSTTPLVEFSTTSSEASAECSEAGVEGDPPMADDDPVVETPGTMDDLIETTRRRSVRRRSTTSDASATEADHADE